MSGRSDCPGRAGGHVLDSEGDCVWCGRTVRAGERLPWWMALVAIVVSVAAVVAVLIGEKVAG